MTLTNGSLTLTIGDEYSYDSINIIDLVFRLRKLVAERYNLINVFALIVNLGIVIDIDLSKLA